MPCTTVLLHWIEEHTCGNIIQFRVPPSLPWNATYWLAGIYVSRYTRRELLFNNISHCPDVIAYAYAYNDNHRQFVLVDVHVQPENVFHVLFSEKIGCWLRASPWSTGDTMQCGNNDPIKWCCQIERVASKFQLVRNFKVMETCWSLTAHIT